MIGGTKGSLQFPNLKYWFYKNERSWWNKILVNEDKNKKDDSTLVNQIDHFVDVVLKKVKPKVNGNDGLISLKIFAAITKSAKSGKKIKL
jgi:predicted dehydrogenase